MPISIAATDVLDREFLGIRARLIDVAAALDRTTRAEGDVGNDPRLERVRQTLEILRTDAPDRAEKLQMVFSLPYREDWKADYGL